MKRILIALFIAIILSIGFVGYTQTNDGANKIMNENNNSITINSF